MRNSLLFMGLAALAALVSASPASSTATSAPIPPLNAPHNKNATFTPTGSLYYLKTEVYNGSKSMDKLYVSAYHVGGGWNDAALAKDIKSASVGFLNGTFQEFDLGNVFPWGLVIQWSEFYTQWLPVQINAGIGGNNQGDRSQGTFTFTNDGLISTWDQWNAWIACDWNHGLPQLFWQTYYKNITIPSNCAFVRLRPVYIAQPIAYKTVAVSVR